MRRPPKWLPVVDGATDSELEGSAFWAADGCHFARQQCLQARQQ